MTDLRVQDVRWWLVLDSPEVVERATWVVDAVRERARKDAARRDLRQQGLARAAEKVRLEHAHRHACWHLSQALAVGLRLREGTYLRGADGWTYWALRVLGAETPPDVTVCLEDGCGLVFRPRRGAALCDRCKAHPKGPALSYEKRDDGGWVVRAPGWTHRTHRCVACSAWFNPVRVDARTCSAGCRQAANRRERLGESAPVRQTP